MKRRIIEIDQDLCIGCGICAEACHEGAIGMIDGKATLLRDDYCDGLGDCLPTCPTGAITFIEREAAPYDEAAVKANQQKKKAHAAAGSDTGCCPSESCLSNWPIQIKLLPVQSPSFAQADLLVAADCTAFSYGNFHQEFVRNHVAIIGCPKLDQADYSEKLTEIFKNNDIHSIKVARMEVPCCGGLEYAVKEAIQNSGKNIPCQVITFSVEGEILNRE